MRSIKEYQKEKIGEKVRKYVNSAWYFDQWYEKMILIILSFLAFLKIFEWIF